MNLERMIKERRCKLIHVPKDVLMCLLTSANNNANMLILPLYDIPRGTILTDIIYKWETESFLIKGYHGSFKRCLEGTDIPWMGHAYSGNGVKFKRNKQRSKL